ncbi:MAG: sigma-54 dependent transcriptional regulator [Nitrospira sp.]|nr:sigma-54 dependent transcriptional regulator [Nitrospira sp.]
MISGKRILIVDDEPAFVRLCTGWLNSLAFQVIHAGDAPQARIQFEQHPCELVLLDLALPPSNQPEEGLALIQSFAQVPVVVLTGHAHRELALTAVEQGAWDFLSKPIDPAMLRMVVSRALNKHALEQELRSLKMNLSSETLGLIGKSPVMEALRELVRRIGPSDLNVMILGPSGSGKELVARALHRLSPRRDNPFVPVHCGAIPTTLLESELFGALKGSYTGADRDRIGMLESAQEGTLFLDEIGEMPQAMQVKLLRFLQEGTFTPVGGRKTKHANVRVICATHRDIGAMVHSGEFREDLYYRLKGMILRTPALRDRQDDLPLLTPILLHRFVKGHPKHMTAEALRLLIDHQWPGNVRELENVLESAVALSGDRAEITQDDIALAMGDQASAPARTQEVKQDVTLPLDEQVQRLEKRLLIEALEETHHNHSQAAQRLGISRAGLLKKMKRLNLR